MKAKKADDEGADYLGIGAIFPSSTKEGAGAIGIDNLNKSDAP